MKRRTFAAATLALAAMRPLAAPAQTYPSRPVTWIVPFPAGNQTDAFARVMARVLSEKIGQPVVVENRTGAAGIIGMQAVAQARPDGYTMVYGSSGPMATFTSLYSRLPYDPLTSFALVQAMASNPLILTVGAGKPFKTVEEFITHLKARPGQLNLGSPGIGTGSHLTGELFQAATGTKMVHVPYRDGSAMYADLISGNIDAVFDFVAVMRPHIESNRVNVLGVTREERLSSFPDVPTLREKGFDVVLSSWSSVAMPANTPAEIVGRMSAAVQEAMRSPEIERFLVANDSTSLAQLDPPRFREFLLSEIQLYRRLVEISGARLE